MILIGFSFVQVGCLAIGIEAQKATLKSERASRAVEKLEAVSNAKALKAALATISTKEGELNAARAALAAEGQALSDVVIAKVEVLAVKAKADDVVAATQTEPEKAA